jgi:pyruvate dehydrogenase E2 component (dihydrolipoamide acetyltransferase)
VADEVKLPRLGQGMEMGTIVRWLKGEGEPVQKGEPLYELDTDKVTQEVEAEASGVLLKIAVKEGEVPVGQTVAVIGQEGEDVSLPAAQPPVRESGPVEGARGNREVPPTERAAADTGAAASAEKPAEAPARDADREEGREAAAEAAGAEPAAHAQAAPANGGRVKASPLARRIARERGIELSSVRGTGPEGRIVAEDVERAEAAPPAAAPAPVVSGEVESIPLTNVRRTIARRLTAAWAVPVFELTVSADMTRANELVERVRERDPEIRVTVTDLLVKVCGQALARHPDVNVQFTDEALLRFPSANVGLAVATGQGLIVPVIRSAERLSLAEIATARADVVGRAREGKLKAADLDEGTFTISNLGMFGVEQFVAVLNPPQAAILAVGATEERAVVVEGELAARPMMTVTLTVDHRAVDGAPAAEFLQTVNALLEDPALAL